MRRLPPPDKRGRVVAGILASSSLTRRLEKAASPRSTWDGTRCDSPHPTAGPASPHVTEPEAAHTATAPPPHPPSPFHLIHCRRLSRWPQPCLTSSFLASTGVKSRSRHQVGRA